MVGVRNRRLRNAMRYENADKVLQLALEMQASRTGLSLDDIEARFAVGRRTAMRMREAVLRVFPQAEEVPSDGERRKRYRIPAGVLDRLVAFTADELADLEAAVALLRRENMADHATSLEGLAAKLKALMKPTVMRRVEPDLEALLEAEGLAMRPGPRPRIRGYVLQDLRSAIMACRKVVLHHRNRATRKLNRRRVLPYGFLYGNRHYLVAYSLHRRKYAIYSLSNIERVEALSEYFERDPDFSLERFAERSFGVYQEEPFDVVWRFLPEAAQQAREFQFHPRQKVEERPDGSLIVRFRAGGALEMAWHLYRWGDKVEVLAPPHLAEMCNPVRRPWPGLP